ncbi:MAG: ABC transporter ATP-binding protein [Elusimicrobia bacterium]|nr:ABC transporter ATP-binding protein [Elusimicrobiota bacterium]
MSNNTILKTANVNKVFGVKRNFLVDSSTNLVNAVKDVSITLEKGKILGIAGESGSGKTTFAKIISGLMEYSTGEIFISDKKITDYSKYDLAKKVQMIFQDPFSSLNPKLSIETIIVEAIRSKQKNAIIPAKELLELVGLPEDSLKKYPHQFSGGQRQRIAIARALAGEPELIIADEPVSSLDISVQAQIMNLFLELREKLGLSYIIISHDLNLLGAVSDEIVIMQNGEIVECGNSTEIMNNPKNSYTQKLISAIKTVSK